MKNEINKLKIENSDLKNKLGSYEPSDKLYNKRRSDVLFRIGNGQIIKQSTIDKYKRTKEELKQK